MKTFKRNAVIVTVLLFVCVAAYLNWSYNKNAGSAASADVAATASAAAAGGSQVSPDGKSSSDDSAGLYYDQNAVKVNSEYFDSARLNRQQARDAASETLAKVSKTENASKQAVDAALKEISQIASDSVKEAELEDLIKAKGFSDCVVYISDSGVSVAVPAPQEGLAASSVAKITDIVTSQTNYKAAALKIIEVK